MILSDQTDINRLIIYFFYDKDGIVDEYVYYMLEDLKKNSKQIMFVCNGKLLNDSRLKLESYVDNIIVRENKGFDVWAYKEAMEFYGWSEIINFDEVILMNFTIMGPLYPFENMFNEMNNRDLDFWGITAFHEYKDGDPFGTIEYGYIPLHIQSHFIAIRKKMLSSFEFKQHWINMREINSYEESVGFHESIFTKKFEDKGFSWDIYVDTSDLYSHSLYPLIMSPLKLVRDKKCPIIKRRSFFHNYDDVLNFNTGEATLEVMEYIEKNLNYDTNMIWDNILRCQNQADIKRNMHLNYILSSNMSKYNDENLKNKKIALVMHIYFEDLIEYCFNYAKSMPSMSDIYITTNTEDKKIKIEEIFSKVSFNRFEVIIIENRGRDVSALLVGCKKFIMDYDFVCFAHDKKVGQLKFGITGESFSYKCFENILKSENFVLNIIETFDKNPKLGILTPPPPNHSDYYPTIGLFDWGCNFYKALELYKEMGLTVNIDFNKEPIAPLGTMFWFRPKALRLLFEKDWEYKDFPEEPNDIDGTLLHAIERLYPFFAQEEGYYPAWVMNDQFTKIEITNLYYMLRELNMLLFKIYGGGRHDYLKNIMKYVSDPDKFDSKSQKDIIFRHLLKMKIKSKTPPFIWNSLKKIKDTVKGKRK